MSLLPDLNSKKLGVAVALTIFALYLALCIGRALTKLPVCDEAWYGQPALNLATGRGMGTTVLETAGTPRQGLDRHTYWEMPLFIVAQSPWYKAFGFGLIQLRLFSTTWGIILLVAWFIFIRVLFQNHLVALITSGLLAVDFQVVNVSATGRTDVMCAALGTVALATYVGLREHHFKTALLLSNALIACSGMTHPNGLIYLVVLAILAFSLDRKRLAWTHLIVVGIPYLLGAALWGSYILQAPADFLAQFGSASRRLWGLASPWAAFMAEISRYRNAYGLGPSTPAWGSVKVLVLLGYIAAVAGVLASRNLRQHTASRLWLTMTLVVFVLMVVYEGAKQDWYLIHIIPFFAALLAVWAVNNWRSRFLSRWGMTVGLLTILLLDVALTARLIHKDDYRNRYLPVVRFLKDHMDQSSLIMGSSELGFQLPFDQVIDDYRLGFYSHKRPQLIVVEPNYQGTFLEYRSREPEVYRHIQSTLRNEYKRVYDDGYYTVYAQAQLSLQARVCGNGGP